MLTRNTVLGAILLTLALGLSGCKSDTVSPETAEDINPNPNVVEINLRAQVSEVEYIPGVKTEVWSYNRMVPGPTIEAKVGDTLVVNFQNDLPEPTTVHWHGLELPANMDGSMIAQKPVQPGGTFRYEFKLLRASTFWYHPHIRGNRTVELGLQGMLIVKDNPRDIRKKLPTDSYNLVLDDVLLDDDGQVVDAEATSPVTNAMVQVNGREGNTLLVSGKVNPELDVPVGIPQRLRIVNSSNSRFMRISIPGARVWRVGGDGGLVESPIEILPIGQVPVMDDGMMAMGGMEMGCMSMGDGMGMSEMEMQSDPDLSKGLLLTPGERADLVAVFYGEPGTSVPLEWHDYKRGRHMACLDDMGGISLGDMEGDGKAPPQTMMTFNLTGRKAVPETAVAYAPPAQLADIEPIDVTGAPAVPIMFGHSNPDTNGDINFFVQMMNGMGVGFDNVTAAMAPTVQVGDTRILEVNNMTMGDHNFHIHGFEFQHIETEFVDMDNPDNNYIVPAERLEDKDTIRLPARPGMTKGRSRTITRLAIKFDDTGREGQIVAYGKTPTETESGGWLFHCHILEHSARGMASFMQVM